jgi:hypothetical protein
MRRSPEDLSKIVIAHQVDPAFQEKIDLLEELGPPAILSFLSRLAPLENREIRPQYAASPNSCYLLVYEGERRSAPLHEVLECRRRMAVELGIAPAPLFEFLPDFDPSFRRLYKSSFTLRCRHLTRSCLRPSHMLVCLLDGTALPQSLDPPSPSTSSPTVPDNR